MRTRARGLSDSLQEQGFDALAGVHHTLFRSRLWRPALVRAGLLGSVTETGPDKWHAMWTDAAGVERSAEFTTEREAVAHVARKAVGGLRFHDVQRAMGHERASTTLDRYTHRSVHRGEHVRSALADDSLTDAPGGGPAS